MATGAFQVVPLQACPPKVGDEAESLPNDEWCRATGPLQVPDHAAAMEGSGHEDLLLQAVLPGLAPGLYPYLVSRAAGVVAILSLAIGTMVPVLALHVRFVPIQWTSMCLFAVVAGVRRAALLDLRVLKLLLRQFETWYLLGNLLVIYWCSLSGLFTAPAEVLCLVHLLSGTSVIFFDALRMQQKMMFATAIAYSGVMFVAAVLLHTEASSKAAHYDKYLFSNVSAASIFEGRALTLSLFYCRYAVKLLYQPGAYTVLALPILADQGWRVSQGTSVCNVSPRPSLGTSGMPQSAGSDDIQGKLCTARYLEDSPTGETPRASAPSNDGLLLEWLSPRFAIRLYPILRHSRCEAFVWLLWVVGLLCMHYIFSFSVAEGGVPLGFAVPSLLMHAPNVRLLAFLHLRTARRLLRRFELWFLLVNMALAPLCVLRGLYAHPSSAMAGCSFITSCFTVPLLDALRVPPSIKLRHTALYVFFLIGITVLDRFAPARGINYDRLLIGRVTIASFYNGRMLTLGIYCLRYTYNLLLRPDICVMLSRPLMREEKQHVFLNTLRTMAGGIGLEGERSLKNIKLPIEANSDFKAGAAADGASAC